ncbi:MAG: hypothetical protein AAF206_31275, partial [Bacteroidota bacterium]
PYLVIDVAGDCNFKWPKNELGNQRVDEFTMTIYVKLSFTKTDYTTGVIFKEKKTKYHYQPLSYEYEVEVNCCPGNGNISYTDPSLDEGEPVSNEGYDIGLIPGVENNLYAGGGFGLGAKSRELALCAGLEAVYFFDHEPDQKLFPAVGADLHYSYTNRGNPDEFVENFDKLNFGPSAALYYMLFPQLLIYGELQATAGIGKSTSRSAFSMEEFVDNTSCLGGGINAGLTVGLPDGNGQLNLETNVVNILRNTRTNADNPDQSFSTTEWEVSANKSNMLRVSYRRKF